MAAIVTRNGRCLVSHSSWNRSQRKVQWEWQLQPPPFHFLVVRVWIHSHYGISLVRSKLGDLFLRLIIVSIWWLFSLGWVIISSLCEVSADLFGFYFELNTLYRDEIAFKMWSPFYWVRDVF